MNNLKLKIFVCLSLLLIQSKSSEANWKVVHTVSTKLIWHIAFADSNTVYAVGDSMLMKSIDGGNNWIDLLPNIASLTSDKKFFNLDFVNKDTGVVFRNTQSENMFLTTDGGITWTDVSPNVMPWGMLDVDFVNQTVGYAVGGFAIMGQPDSIIARTTDGGQTWTNVSKPPLCEHPMAIKFLTDSIGFTGDEEIYKTTDAGTTWILATTPAGWISGDRITDFKFFDDLTGFAITDKWHIYKTMDGGNSWQFTQLPVSPINGCRDIVFDQNNFGYIVGFGLFQPFISSDAGNSWVIDGSYSPYYPATCASTSADHKIIIGTREGDVILKENGPLSSHTQMDLSSINIYPNPSKGMFYFSTNTNQKVKSIEVFNLLGSCVYSEKPNLINNFYEINLTDLPNGLYVVKISDEAISIQKKLIKE